MKTRHRSGLLLFSCSLLLLVIGVGDYLTGRSMGFFVFYFIPIAILAWRVGERAAIAMAFAAALIWFTSDLLAGAALLEFHLWWNMFIRLISFLIIAITLSELGVLLSRERKTNAELQEALKTIKQLSGILPMCSFCRKIRNDEQEWIPLEKYLADHSDAKVSHGLCPHCYRKYYGQVDGT